MADTFYDSELTGEQIDKALTAIDGLIVPSNNGKVVAVQNGKLVAKSVSEWGGEATLEHLSVNANGDYYPGTGVDGFDEVHVSVPNSYTAADEGKVVSSGALVAQTARSSPITENGTYDTTENNAVTVNVSGGIPNLQAKTATQNGLVLPDAGYDGLSQVTVNVSGGGGAVAAFLKITYTAGATCTATDGTTTLTAPDTSGYWVVELPNAGVWTIQEVGAITKEKSVSVVYSDSIVVNVTSVLPDGYLKVEYLATGNTAGAYINTGVEQKSTSYFDLEMQFSASPGTDNWAFGTLYGGGSNEIGVNGDSILFWINNSGHQFTFDTLKHTYEYKATGCYVDGIIVNTRTGRNRNTYYYDLFARGGVNGSPNNPTPNCRIYHCKIYDGDTIIRDFYPCYRVSDHEPGMYDVVNSVFYPNYGTESFIVGPEV